MHQKKNQDAGALQSNKQQVSGYFFILVHQ
jgi:hypothetical protein